MKTAERPETEHPAARGRQLPHYLYRQHKRKTLANLQGEDPVSSQITMNRPAPFVFVFIYQSVRSEFLAIRFPLRIVLQVQ
jgi:hypothetical protein